MDFDFRPYFLPFFLLFTFIAYFLLFTLDSCLCLFLFTFYILLLTLLLTFDFWPYFLLLVSTFYFNCLFFTFDFCLLTLPFLFTFYFLLFTYYLLLFTFYLLLLNLLLTFDLDFLLYFTLQAWYDLGINIRNVTLNSNTLEISLGPSPISQGGHLTQIQPSSHVDEYFQSTLLIFLNKSVVSIFKRKLHLEGTDIYAKSRFRPKS